jgi:hypothetical protein
MALPERMFSPREAGKWIAVPANGELSSIINRKRR